MKRLTISKLKKKAWKLFSQYIRQKYAIGGYVRCITCGKHGLIAEFHAGHFIHGNTKKTYFDERNVHPQCVGCNMYRSGHLAIYAIRLEELYGRGILQKLETLSWEIGFKRHELEEIIMRYKS